IASMIFFRGISSRQADPKCCVAAAYKGFDTAAIMRAGGWKSVNVLARYLEYAEQNVWEA
ncbi:hypothetical protein ACGYLL_16685, partial [Sulfitobacter sp. M23905]|uniref:hypothetical protein n=1 Tax=Sulfitobacter sp. M23905 TaxID=3368578 RepID=UPI00374753B0